MRRALIPLTVCLMLLACAISPLDTSGVDNPATPNEIVAGMPRGQHSRVQWGGVIVTISNQDRATLIEVLSYPLGRDGRPETGRAPTGRFKFRRREFLEPQDYAPGRLLTVVGTVTAVTRTRVDRTTLVVPLIDAEQLKLWEPAYATPAQPRFGVGISIGL